MDVLIPRCCGLDVHQKTVVASVRILGPTGEVTRETRTFGTTTRELEALAAWLRPFQITHIAMEATGVLWKPVWHVLEPEWQLLLVNPLHLKRVPGRKSDVQDAEWIAQLLQCGLLRGSFVPPVAIRELRDLTRTRTTMEDEVTAVVNRIHKVLEDANIKLSTVASASWASRDARCCRRWPTAKPIRSGSRIWPGAACVASAPRWPRPCTGASRTITAFCSGVS